MTAFYLVLAVLGIPSSLVGLWQLAVYVHRGSRLVREALRRAAEAPAEEPAPAPAVEQTPMRTIPQLQPPVFAPPSGVNVTRFHSRYDGGAVPTIGSIGTGYSTMLYDPDPLEPTNISRLLGDRWTPGTTANA